jgi:hypothetical protein
MGFPSPRPQEDEFAWVGDDDFSNSFKVGKATDDEFEFLVPVVKMAAEPQIGGLAGANAAVTLAASATVIAVTSKVMTVTGDGGANTIGTITGGIDGMTLTLIFVDTNVTITDLTTEAADTVNLSAAFTGADGTVLSLVYDGTSWREVSRSVNG